MNIRSRFVFVLFMVLSAPAFALTCNSNMDTIAQATEPGLGDGLAVEYDQLRKQLRVTARQQQLNTVLAHITDATSIKFTNDADNGCDLVNIEFGFLTLGNALAQVLSGRSYIVRESSLHAYRVWLLPVGNAQTSTDIDVVQEEFYDRLSSSSDGRELAEILRNMTP
jgi:hypothetical protein